MNENLKALVKEWLPTSALSGIRAFRRRVDFVRVVNAPAACRKNSENVWNLLFHGRPDLIARKFLAPGFDFAAIDKAMLQKLSEAFGEQNEGCLIDSDLNDLRVRSQLGFIAAALRKKKPARILETGTHKALFCYIARLWNPNVKLDTFGIQEQSGAAVKALNETFGHYVDFHLGDSTETLTRFTPDYRIDLAWVDGGHEVDVCLKDLQNCARLGIPSILVDDYKWMPEVQQAVSYFTKDHPYRLLRTSDLADYRGIALLECHRR